MPLIPTIPYPYSGYQCPLIAHIHTLIPIVHTLIPIIPYPLFRFSVPLIPAIRPLPRDYSVPKAWGMSV